jgi:putative transposase
MPKRYEPDKKHSFSGTRIKRGLYKSQHGTLLNADTNGAYNILRKTDPKFSFSSLVQQVGSKINEWLHPVKRIRFLKNKTHKQKKPSVMLPTGQLELF